MPLPTLSSIRKIFRPCYRLLDELATSCSPSSSKNLRIVPWRRTRPRFGLLSLLALSHSRSRSANNIYERSILKLDSEDLLVSRMDDGSSLGMISITSEVRSA